MMKNEVHQKKTTPQKIPWPTGRFFLQFQFFQFQFFQFQFFQKNTIFKTLKRFFGVVKVPIRTPEIWIELDQFENDPMTIDRHPSLPLKDFQELSILVGEGIVLNFENIPVLLTTTVSNNDFKIKCYQGLVAWENKTLC